ncbi:carbohydrate ABC transporter permease [candidate division KSB1 bacterium]|nr:carbohydrate ABC transporter permease [candidate division KSB1 bacterium]
MRAFRKSLYYGTITGIGILMFFPMIWMVYSSMKTNREIFEAPWALPSEFHLEHFVQAWNDGNIGIYIWNSLFVGVISVIGILIISSLAAYAFSRLQFKGRDVLFYVFLIGLIIPIQAFLLPLFIFLRDAHLINTRLGLILPYIAWGLPLAIYLLRAYLLTLPHDLEDSAKIDGCSIPGIYYRIVLPLIKPALATVAIISALDVWNEFLMALIFIYDNELKTLPIGLIAFYGQHSIDYKLLFSALSLITIPMIAIYFMFQRYIIEGLTVGALKE